MEPLGYADAKIGEREIWMTTASTIIGVGILTLPRLVAAATRSSDGWISILLAGIFAFFFAWVVSMVVKRMNRHSFFEFAGKVATKPVAYVFTWFQAIYFLTLCAYEIRAITIISKQYLFEKTPVEALALSFFLVVIYAVSGSRVGLIRLNVLFLPFVIFVLFAVLFASIGLFQAENLEPFFITEGSQIVKGAREAVFALFGFEVILFYAAMIRQPQKVTKAMLIGVSIPLVTYLAVFIFVIGIFSHTGTVNAIFPTIEFAKEIQIPGKFFERLESFLFVIWIMTIFNTTSMAMDATIHCLSSMMKKVHKRTWIYVLSPLIYLACMIPQNTAEFAVLGTILSLLGVGAAAIIPAVLLLLARLREARS